MAKRSTVRSTVLCVIAAAAFACSGTVLVPASAQASPAADAATASRTTAALNVDPAGYPYPNSSTKQEDPWGFAVRQCTSYAAWWLNANGLNLTSYTRGPAGAAHFGNASGWAASAQQAGWVISSTPQVGAIAQWNAGETSSWAGATQTDSFTAGSLGHVAVVTAIDASTGLATLASYNVNDSYAFSTFQGVAPRYLLIGFAAGVTATTAPTTTSSAPVRTTIAPVTRAVTGVVAVYDVRGHRIGVRLAPLTVADGRLHLKPRLLPGGGFHVTLPAPGPWKLSASMRGYRCTSGTVAVTSARAVKVSLACRK